MKRLETLKALHKQMDQLQTKLSNWGASDTEPDYHYQNAVRNAFSGKEFEPLTCRQWEMFDKPGFENAVRLMNSLTQKIVNYIRSTPLSEIGELKKWAQQNLWRVDIE